MFPALFVLLRTYSPYVTLPFAAVIGFIGYKIEGIISDKYTPYQESIGEKRDERLLKDLDNDVTVVDSLKERKFVPRTVFEKNVSPSLLKENS